MSPVPAQNPPAIVRSVEAGESADFASDPFVSGPGIGTIVDLSSVAANPPTSKDTRAEVVALERRLNEMFPESADENWIAAERLALPAGTQRSRAGAPVGPDELANTSIGRRGLNEAA